MDRKGFRRNKGERKKREKVARDAHLQSEAEPDTPSNKQPTAEEDDEVDVRALSLVQLRQLQSRRAVRRLRSPPETLIWKPEHHDILSANIKLLLDATRNPLVLGNDDYEDHTPPAPTTKAPKRHRTLDPNLEASTEAPLKRLRVGAIARVSEPQDLAALNPQPLQFDFPMHPIEDYSDDWFVSEFRKLFRIIETFFEDYFCIHDLNEGDFYQPWAVNHTPEFLSYVLEVADADPEQGGWDRVLRDTNQRKWLLVGILMRILEVKVFDEDLWGATETEKELMFSIDRALFNQEGFSRTNLRSETVRTILGPSPVTRHFHLEVARLTAQISLLFKPLSDYLYAIPPPEGKTIPLIWDQYQSIHNIVAIAAYLSLCIRLSPTIFYFTALSPNDAYLPADQHSLEIQIYTDSKQKIADDYSAAAQIFNDRTTALQAASSTAEGPIDTKKGRKVVADLKTHLANPPHHHAISHRAMARICAWPNIRRFKPGSLEQEKAGIPLENRNGFRIYEVSKSAAVFYFGIENRAERARHSVCLRGWVVKKQDQYNNSLKRRKKSAGAALAPYVAATAIAAAIPCFVFAESFKNLAGEYMGQKMMGLAENLRRTHTYL